MKKLLLVALTLISINSICQDRIVQRAFKPNIYCNTKTYYEYIGHAQDTLTLNQDSISYEFYIAKPISIGYYLNVNITDNCIIKYQARQFIDDDWVNIPNYNYKKNIYYRYIRILLIYNGTNIQVNNIECKLIYNCIPN